MSESMDSRKSRSELTDMMMVIVNRDWRRTYVASLKITNTVDGKRNYSAKCELKSNAIVSSANDKNQLSTNMDEMATIIEDHLTQEIPESTPIIAGAGCILN